MKRSLILAVVAAGFVAVPLTAALAEMAGHGRHGAYDRQGGHGQARFEAVDADKDGKITRAEAMAYGEARFAKADTDGDGKLSRAEMEAQMIERMKASIEKRLDKRLEKADADKDGAISKAEAEALGDRFFARMDRDDDGEIERREIRRKRHRRMGGGHGHHMRHEHHGGRPDHDHHTDHDHRTR